MHRSVPLPRRWGSHLASRSRSAAAPSHGATFVVAAGVLGITLLVAASNGKVESSAEARAALVAVLACVILAATIATRLHLRARPDTRSGLMAAAFSAMAVVLIARVTAMVPGPLYSPGIARIGEMATLPLGGVILALSGTPTMRQRRRLDEITQSAIALPLALAAILGITFTSAAFIPAVPRPGSDAALTLFVLNAILFSVLARRASRTATLSERGTDGLVIVGTVAAICAYWGLANAFRNDVLWWTAHGLELVGLTAMCVPATMDLWRAKASRPLVGDLSAADIVADEVSFLDGRVHHLLLQLARKDDVTEGHTRRVAMLAVQMGERLGLDATSLRDLAAGGLLHDIGKLNTPDDILKKPGKLTDDEYAVIKRHPVDGERMLREVGRFNDRVLHLVSAHHERLDGRGYPSGAAEATIELEARILAVADVYDALTSHRPYRPAWPADRALEVIEREVGEAFDPRCVAALRSIVAPGRYVPRRFQHQATRAKERRRVLA